MTDRVSKQKKDDKIVIAYCISKLKKRTKAKKQLDHEIKKKKYVDRAVKYRKINFFKIFSPDPAESYLPD